MTDGNSMKFLLTLNREDDKECVAIKKILRYHRDFDLKTLFGWEFKALPYVARWMERVAAYYDISQEISKGGSYLQSISLSEACPCCMFRPVQGRTKPQRRGSMLARRLREVLDTWGAGSSV